MSKLIRQVEINVYSNGEVKITAWNKQDHSNRRMTMEEFREFFIEFFEGGLE